MLGHLHFDYIFCGDAVLLHNHVFSSTRLGGEMQELLIDTTKNVAVEEWRYH